LSEPAAGRGRRDQRATRHFDPDALTAITTAAPARSVREAKRSVPNPVPPGHGYPNAKALDQAREAILTPTRVPHVSAAEKSVVMMVSDQPAARMLARSIAERNIALKAIIIQVPRPRQKTWKDKVRDLLGDAHFLRFASLRWPAEARRLYYAERRLQKNAARILTGAIGDGSLSFPKTRVLRTSDINSDEVFQLLQQAAPDLIVVYATGLLRRRIIDSAPLGAINAHTAVLPDYRGACAESWQLFNSAYDKTGISIHFIDEGVDTGDIIYTKRVTVSVGTDPFTLRALNTVEIVRNYPAIVERVLGGNVERHAQGKSSTPCFRERDWTTTHKRILFERLKLFRPGSTPAYWLRAIARRAAASRGRWGSPVKAMATILADLVDFGSTYGDVDGRGIRSLNPQRPWRDLPPRPGE